jgi:hypothetical protein
VQPGVLYPLSLPYLFLPQDLAFNWTIVFHFFLAGAFTYALMRELRASIQGALAAALAFVFSGYLISIHNVLNTLISVSWYPLIIYCCCRMIRTGLRRWSVASGVSLCCMFLGGGVEAVIFALASLVILSFYPGALPVSLADNSPSLQRRLGLLGLTVIIFLGLSMIQLMPFLELYRQSHRFGGVPLEEATRWSLEPRDLIYLILPDIYGYRLGPDLYWKLQNYLKSIYVGPICLFLAAIYFFRQRKRGLPLLAALGLVVILGLGRYTPLYPFLYKYFPLFAVLRYPVKFIFLFVFWLCVAAGLGLEFISLRFSENRHISNFHQALLTITTIGLAGLLVLTRFFPGQVADFAQQWLGNLLDLSYLSMALHNLNRLLFFGILSMLVIFFGLRHKLARLGGPLLLMLLTLDLFLGNRGYAIKLDSTSFHAETGIIRTLRADPDLFRFHVLPGVDALEVPVKSYADYHQARKEFLEYDLMMEHHLFDIDGYNVPLQPRYEAFINLIRDKPLVPSRTLLDMLNVKYVLTQEPVNLPGYVYVQDGLETSKLYENRNSLPRAFLVKNFQVLSSGEEFASAFVDPNFYPRNTVLLEKIPERLQALKKKPTLPSLKSAAKVIVYENNRIVLEVTTPEAALLFLSESYYPGWKAFVNGSQEEILRANFVFRAIPLGPGSHQVEVVYQPLSFKIGLLVSLFTIFVLLIAWSISTRRRRLTK